MAEGTIENVTEGTEKLRLNKNLTVPSREGIRPEVKIGQAVPGKFEATDPSVPEGPKPQQPVENIKSAGEIRDMYEGSKGLDMPPQSQAPHRNGFRAWLRKEIPKFQDKSK